jgi:hypothetical protein
MKKAALIIMACLLLASCAGVPLMVNELPNIISRDDEVFTLIYFVGTERNDIRRAVVLDLEDDAYTIKPDVEAFEYEILQTIDIGESLYEAEIFFRHEGNKGYKKAAIITPDGHVAGYELRPQFEKEFMGVEDLMDLSYELDEKTGNIKIKIKLRASIKRLVY